MSTVEITRCRNQLESLFKQINELPEDNGLVRAHWARYLCIIACGYLEISVRELLSSYTQSRSNRAVTNYVERQLRQFRNPNFEKILQLVRTFNTSWSDDLLGFAEGAPKEAVNSIVNHRHSIAHGQNTTLSYHQIRQFVDDAQKVIDRIDKLCRG